LTSLTFYGGINEIGGNKILLEDQDTKVFLDFEEYINPRVANGIEDFLTMGLLPDVKGLYRAHKTRLFGLNGPYALTDSFFTF
jgi:ribonuclease J